MTPVQEETRQLSVENTAEMTAALTLCKTQYERDQCRAAYARRFWALADAVGQRHGLAAMEWRR